MIDEIKNIKKRQRTLKENNFKEMIGSLKIT